MRDLEMEAGWGGLQRLLGKCECLGCHSEISCWPKFSLGVYCAVLWKSPNNVLGQPNTIAWVPSTIEINVFTVLEASKFKIKVLANLIPDFWFPNSRPGYHLASWPHDLSFAYTQQGGKGMQVSNASSNKGTNPVTRAPPSWSLLILIIS